MIMVMMMINIIIRKGESREENREGKRSEFRVGVKQGVRRAGSCQVDFPKQMVRANLKCSKRGFLSRFGPKMASKPEF